MSHVKTLSENSIENITSSEVSRKLYNKRRQQNDHQQKENQKRKTVSRSV